MTLEDAILTNSRLRARTRALYLTAVQDYAAFVGDARRHLTLRTRDSVLAWQEHLVAQQLAPQTINLALRGLRCAAKRGAHDFTKDIPGVPAKAATPRPPLTLGQVRALIGATAGERPIDLRDRALLVLGFRTGMRRTALCALKRDDLDLKQARVRVPLKAGKEEILDLDAETVAALAPWVAWVLPHARARQQTIFRALARTRVDGSVSVRGPMTEHGVYFVLADRAQKAGLRVPMYPHLFRCTRATWNGVVPALV